MATAEEIAALRLLIAETTSVPPYDDVSLSARLDAATGSADIVAYDIWTEKAAKFTTLVDISEGGSSRKNGDLQEQALAMAAYFANRVTAGSSEPVNRRTRIHRLTRT